MAGNPANLLQIGAITVQRGLEDRGQVLGLLLDESTTSETVNGSLLLRAGPGKSTLAVSEWYVDAVNGSDAFDGRTPVTAFKTFGKLASVLFVKEFNLLPGRLSVAISPIQLIVINILSDLPASDPIKLRGDLPPNSLLAFVGAATTVATGIVSASVAQNRATNTPWSFTDNTITWATHLGRRIRVTGASPNAGNICWVAKDLGAGAARVSTPNDPNLPPPADRLFQTAVTPGILTDGDTFVIEDPVKVYMDYVDVSSSFQGQATIPTVGFANFDFQRAGTLAISSCTTPGGDMEPVFKGCRFRGAVLPRPSLQRIHFANCEFDLGLNIVRASYFVSGGLSRGEVGVRGGLAQLQSDFMIQGSRLNVLFGLAQATLMSVFDSLNSGVVVGADLGGDATANVIITTLWGAGNTLYGMDVLGGRRALYVSALPTLTGLSGDFRMAGNTVNILSQDAAGAYAPLANTWAALALVGNAQIPSRGCGIFKTTV